MFNLFPKMVIPVSVFTPIKNQLQGTISVITGSKKIQGMNSLFTREVNVGSQITINDIVVGNVGRVIDDNNFLLENNIDISTGEYTGYVTNFQESNLGRPVEFTDILVRVKVVEKYIQNATALIPYTVKEGETIEYLSKIFYGSAFYHWVIVLINNIINTREEWPLSETQLNEKIKLLYPQSKKDDIFYYREVGTDYIVEYDVQRLALEEIYPVTIYEHEFNLNEKKRFIKILDPIFIPQFISDFTNSLK